jgi:hypothetical protein
MIPDDVTTGTSLVTTAGKSHSCERPTSRCAPPMRARTSVADGCRETTRGARAPARPSAGQHASPRPIRELMSSNIRLPGMMGVSPLFIRSDMWLHCRSSLAPESCLQARLGVPRCRTFSVLGFQLRRRSVRPEVSCKQMALGPLWALAMLVQAGEPTCADSASISALALCPAWAVRVAVGPFSPAVCTSGAARPWQRPGYRGAHAARTRMASRDEGELAQRKRRVMLRVRIRIMEDVVRRVNDPALSYPRKRETVSELEGYLRRMRALTVDHEPGGPEVIARWPEVQRRQSDDARRRRAQAQIEQTISRMRDAKAVAVLRGKSPQRLVARGLELALCGCKCMEVTLDSPGAMAVVRTLAEQLPNAVLLGAATAMGAEDAAAAISAGPLLACVTPALLRPMPSSARSLRSRDAMWVAKCVRAGCGRLQ